MSNKSQLQTNNTKLDSLIETLRGKAIGGGNGGTIDTCTVSSARYGFFSNIWFTIVDDAGVITTKNMVFEGLRIGQVECLNVVCGSLLIIEGDWSEYSITGTAECIFTSENYSIFKAPIVAGEDCLISVL